MNDARPAADAGSTTPPIEPDEASLRLCAVTRASLPKAALIRFALAPDGGIVPDVAEKLPGRGVWVTATTHAVADAVKRKVFAKSLQKAVAVPDDLAGRVDRLLAERARQALSFANKAGLVATGFAKVEAEIVAGRAVALVQASDGAEDGLAKLARKHVAIAAAAGKPGLIARVLTCEELSLAIGRENVIHAVLADGGQSRAFLCAALRLQRYRLSELAVEFAAVGPSPAAPLGSSTDHA